MVIEWKLFWAWRNALTTDAAKRPLPKKRPWPAMITLPTDAGHPPREELRGTNNTVYGWAR